MSLASSAILDDLAQVEMQRRARVGDPLLHQRVLLLKDYQQQRFARTHADLIDDPRFAPAARFFLEDLYGPQDFSQRDAQFARVVPALVRLFPHEIVATVQMMSSLHALSERLDNATARHLPGGPVQASDYVRAWQAAAELAARARQIDCVVAVGRQLQRYTRSFVLRQSLRLMRKPAHAAGLADLQRFLERGFDIFAGLNQSDRFLALLEQRERALMHRLFAPDAVARATGELP
jgi:hypothetical protein